MNRCRICNNSNCNKTYLAREMMFGYRDEFEYFECSNCGCLQIKKFPANLTKYYPPNYLSFSKPQLPKLLSLNSFFLRQRLLYALDEKNFLGFLLSKVFDTPYLPEWVKKVKLKPDSSVLDVGCGAGSLLLRLRKKGFCDLMGVDPFIKDDIFYKHGVRIFKKEIENIEGQFDFIMLHHSLEHMPDPLSALKSSNRLLKSGRYVLIRVPVVPSYAWRKYKTNWAQLDAPRHLFLHSIKSVEILSNQAGFEVVDITFDSDSFQFWGSEQYVKGIPLTESRSYWVNREGSIFSDKDIKRFEEKSQELNKNNDGDQACFYLYKK